MIEFELAKTLQTASGPLRFEASAVLEDGSCTALFGPSGSGKTMLLRMLAGLERPDGGCIVVRGRTWFDSAAGIDLPPQRRSVGLVFQDYALFPNLDVRANVAYGAARNDAAWVNELLERTDLLGMQHRRPERLSGGQKQRVALARALARRPDLVLLDEPLSALDVALRARLQDDLLALHERLGFTALLVSHDIGEVFKLSRHVLRLNHGRIVQSGPPSAVFLRQRLAGRLNLHAQVLEVRREDVVHVVSLLIGRDVIDIIASDEEAAALRTGDVVSLSAKAISPMIMGK